MEKEFINYKSKNNLYFHHTFSSYENNQRIVFNTEWHLGVEIFFLIAGEVLYKVEGREIPVSAGEILITPPNTAHSLNIDASKPFDRMVLSFPLEALPPLNNLNYLSFFTDMQKHNYILSAKDVQDYKLDEYMKQCKELCVVNSPYCDMQIISQILKIIYSLTKITEALSLQDVRSSLEPKPYSPAERYVQYINEHITKDISVHTLSNAFHVSVSKISLLFKTEIGVSINKYIINQKMLLACKLLLEGYSANTVARMVGYEHYFTFFRNFKAKTQLTPKKYVAIHSSRLIKK